MLAAICVQCESMERDSSGVSGGGADASFIACEKAVVLAHVINELLQNALKWGAPGADGESVQVAYAAVPKKC
jgi:two-component sensor histidine kinase